MIYSLIPAKITSSRLPFKNTFKFTLCDKPLIAYTIEEVKLAGFQPYVFTDEKNIENTYGAKIIKRETKISGLKTTMKETVSVFIEKLNLSDDDIILLTYLTCPFRTAVNINEALGLFQKTNSNSLQSISAVNYRPYGLMKKRDNTEHIFYCLQSQEDYYQKQNTPILYRANGAIYIFRVSELENLNNQMFNELTIGYELDEIQGFDIDTNFDYMAAEKILERKNNERIISKLPGQTISEAEFDTTWSMLHKQQFETSKT